ncbi:hypothetical protein A6U88_13700 [Agrobacterium sp. B131/95]|nr:hypothetical protein PMI03_00273 [Rhizobium sp. AP16]OCJ18922.1 hypothetical protein A6U88_13700 [Agrobacterium sp. B131/95]
MTDLDRRFAVAIRVARGILEPRNAAAETILALISPDGWQHNLTNRASVTAPIFPVARYFAGAQAANGRL